ncbi:hypothetical protein APHWI1_0958 [Anaplasma phagocytophilum str. ApWI1]|uniref:Uncharacterized protein n=1 Tax=Anaplasma phagocytophilum str. ApWI1 TaxID=1359155 RepID=A0A0F3PXC6_ANAPH|nr:hypothetical protein APHWI1_0958 [Anaplasma phagocytophilum str. ApWI1]KJV99653.1 hypothetical protein OTSANNIE_0132 [Anaplasma phagocytophilum str. Annie]KJZ99911.1 hypothetical protein APHDU1_0717 [Anaplasma phagocytophilum]
MQRDSCTEITTYLGAEEKEVIACHNTPPLTSLIVHVLKQLS